MKGSTLGAIIFIIIGVIITIIGVIFFELNRSKSQSQPWWVFVLIIGGPIIAILAAIVLAFSLRPETEIKVEETSYLY